ncbi:MAG TPA: helix-turn-helix domain-containing protein [Acidimicrobiia bacterium]|nr:helix-turn-helix domain-containing protein [Acidimicrobiia bacterium]
MGVDVGTEVGDRAGGEDARLEGVGLDIEVLKALGDETRYAMYREIAAASSPVSAQELAEGLGLHPNTVRLHLERLREAGLVEVEAVHRGTVGRPQHRYSLAARAPAIGVDPPAHLVFAGLLAALAEHAGAAGDDAARTGFAWGAAAAKRTRTHSCLRALQTELARLGFDPRPGEEAGPGADHVRIEFLRCPFRELAEAYPELVCQLHRGLCEGVVSEAGGGRVEEFAALHDSEPCHVVVSPGYPEQD